MGHKITVTAKPVTAGPAGVMATPEEIAELEELWSALFSIRDDQYAHYIADSGTKQEMDGYKARANAYLRNRPEGALWLRQVRRQNLPVGQMKFVIAPYTKGATE